jgi:hypothetical protein
MINFVISIALTLYIYIINATILPFSAKHFLSDGSQLKSQLKFTGNLRAAFPPGFNHIHDEHIPSRVPHSSVSLLCSSQHSVPLVFLTAQCFSCVPHSSVFLSCSSQLSVPLVSLTAQCSSCVPHSSVFLLCSSQLSVPLVFLTTQCSSCVPHSRVSKVFGFSQNLETSSRTG